MQEPCLKLKEIIWEITSECNNNCNYCGSTSQCSTKTDYEKIKLIACEISKYKPEEINISGGDPLLVPFEIHEFVKNILPDVKRKIIINPKSIAKNKENEPLRNAMFQTLFLYDAIGISVNDQEEFKILQDMYTSFRYALNLTPTIITNFNLSNVFLFDQINEFCNTNNNIWQIQFTTYQEGDNTLALYSDNNDLACKFLFESIDSALKHGSKIVLADNMNDGKCTAGKYSLGILSSGSVVPCLSMRSWTNPSDFTQGNILEQQASFGEAPNLAVIWQSKFQDHRFGKFKCCKDACNNKCFKKSLPIDELRKAIKDIDNKKPVIKVDEPFDEIPPVENPPTSYPEFPRPMVMMYGVKDTWTGD